MKAHISAMLCAAVLAGSLCGCASVNEAENSDTVQIVATIFPVYDWVREIVGPDTPGIEVSLLLDSRVDMHSYQPTAEDMLKLSTCDLFLYVGGESDEWVQDALAGIRNPDLVTVNLLDALGDAAKTEEAVEGMQTDENSMDADEVEYDEHIWLSVRNAEVLCQYIADRLDEISPAHKANFDLNTRSYIRELNALDVKYRDAVAVAKTKTVLFGDRFPFRYLMDDYGLDYYAAFSGCSAETEASFETVVFLADKVDELGLTSVLTLEGSDSKIARTIVDNTRAKDAAILTMDSMQSTSLTDVRNGASYLAAMNRNLDALKAALGVEEWL